MAGKEQLLHLAVLLTQRLTFAFNFVTVVHLCTWISSTIFEGNTALMHVAIWRVRVSANLLRSSGGLRTVWPHTKIWLELRQLLNQLKSRLFMFMVLHCDGITTMYSFVLNVDVVIHQIATLLLIFTASSQLLINSNRCSTLHPLIELMRLPGVT